MTYNATAQRIADCFIDAAATVCYDWGICNVASGDPNDVTTMLRWKCHCNDLRFEEDGAAWTTVTQPSCRYDAWEVPGVKDWAIPYSYANGIMASMVMTFAVVSLIRLGRAGKVKRNLSTVALSLVAFSYLQMLLAQFLIAAHGDGRMVEAAAPAPEARARIGSLKEALALLLLSYLSNIGTLSAFVLMWFFWRRLTSPVFLSSRVNFGTKRQIGYLVTADVLLVIIACGTLIKDTYLLVYGVVYIVWKIGFAISFGIAGIRATQMLATLYKDMETFGSANYSTLGYNNSALPPPTNGVAITIGNGNQSSAAIAPAPLPASIPAAPAPPLPPSPPAVTTTNNGAAYLVTDTNGTIAAATTATSPPPQVGEEQQLVAAPRASMISNGAQTAAMAAIAQAQAKQERERRRVIRKTTQLTIGGSIVCMLQAVLFIIVGFGSSSNASFKVAANCTSVPLSCIWAALMVATFHLPISTSTGSSGGAPPSAGKGDTGSAAAKGVPSGANNNGGSGAGVGGGGGSGYATGRDSPMARIGRSNGNGNTGGISGGGSMPSLPSIDPTPKSGDDSPLHASSGHGTPLQSGSSAGGNGNGSARTLNTGGGLSSRMSSPVAQAWGASPRSGGVAMAPLAST